MTFETKKSSENDHWITLYNYKYSYMDIGGELGGLKSSFKTFPSPSEDILI